MRIDGVVFLTHSNFVLSQPQSKDKMDAAAEDHTIIQLGPLDQNCTLK